MKTSDRLLIFSMIYSAAWIVEADVDWLKSLCIICLTISGLIFIQNQDNNKDNL